MSQSANPIEPIDILTTINQKIEKLNIKKEQIIHNRNQVVLQDVVSNVIAHHDMRNHIEQEINSQLMYNRDFFPRTGMYTITISVHIDSNGNLSF